MQVYNINNIAFGTNVKVYRGIRNYYKKVGKEDLLNRSIEKLQKNGVDDFLVVAECINQRNDSYLSADVFEIRNHELFCGENITKNIEKELPDLENVYLEAKQNMHSVSNGFFSLLNTLRGNF